MYPTNLAVVVLVGGYQHLIEGIISEQSHVKVFCIACMWDVLVMYPMNLHVVFAINTCMDINNTIVNIVLMYLNSSIGV